MGCQRMYTKLFNISNLKVNINRGDSYRLVDFSAEEHCLIAIYYVNQLVKAIQQEFSSNGTANFRLTSLLRDEPMSSQETDRLCFTLSPSIQLLVEPVDFDHSDEIAASLCLESASINQQFLQTTVL